MRLDLYLYFNGLARSRTHAANLIKTGKVTAGGQIQLKSSYDLKNGETVEIDSSDDYASLGGIKLKKALEYFHISVQGKTAVDIGASNGGFTDVLLKSGASKVYAVDVSETALPDSLLHDERVVVKDRLNARYLVFEDIGIKAGVITADVSFISLKYIIPPMLQFFDEDTVMIALIKPQFELDKSCLNKSGIVKNKKLEASAIDSVSKYAKSLGLTVVGVTEAPHPFENKNQEYLIALTR